MKIQTAPPPPPADSSELGSVVARVTASHWGEDLVVRQTPANGLVAVLTRQDERGTSVFTYDRVQMLAVRASPGLAEGARAALYWNLERFNSWYGLGLRIDQVGEYVTYDAKQLALTIVKDKNGQTLFSGFHFENAMRPDQYRRGDGG